MSRAYQSRLWHKHPGLVKVIGKVVVDASGDITTASSDTPGVTVAHTSTGKYTLTLADKQYAFFGGSVSVLKTTVANVQAQINAASMTTPSVIVDFFTVDRSPNVLVEPASLTFFYEFNVTQSSASQ